MALASDFQQAGPKVLSCINRMSMVGAVDATVSGNSTMAALINAVLALGPVAGAGPDANREIADGLQLALDAGFLSSTHGQTTIAGLASAAAAQITDYQIASTYDASMME